MIRTLIVDDHAITRRGIASLLKSKPGFAVSGEATNGVDAVRLAGEIRPDVVLMDLMMPGLDGVEATKRITSAKSDGRLVPAVLILTTFSLADGIAHALANGASGAILKSADFDEILKAIRTVAAGGEYVSEELRQMLKDNPAVPELTGRQTEVLESMVSGLTNEDIARNLGLSLSVVKEHIRAVFNKLGVANRSEAVAIALRKHLLKI